MKISDVLKKPRLTEKSYNHMSENKYVFEIDEHASKNDVKAAVENLYGVDVIGVRTIHLRSKKKVRGIKRNVVRTGVTKKAIVEVKEGQSIKTFDEIFKTDTK